jgi:peptidoglycan-N-acetylglucosamine deacetylase
VINRYTCLLSNVVPGDWRDPEGWAGRALGSCKARAWSIGVLHDIHKRAARHLGRFLDEAQDSGVRFRQDFAPDLLPVRAGNVVRPLDRRVSDLA